MKKPNLGSLRRRAASLLTAFTFLVLAVTGLLAFVRPFSIGVVGLHALMGFVFIVLVGLHIVNNIRPLKGYMHSRAACTTLAITAALTAVFLLQPAPVKTLLGLSGNLGPAMERFEMNGDGMLFHYSPSADYRMALTVKTGSSYSLSSPPQIAIWLENQGAYHFKTLLAPEAPDTDRLPYWVFKRKGWEKAKRQAKQRSEVDAIVSATPNGSFDPADYILPSGQKDSTPFKLLIEINQPGDGQPSLVYAVEIDNSRPSTYQLLDLVGYPKREDEDGKEAWALYYADESVDSALELIDSALLTIDRSE